MVTTTASYPISLIARIREHYMPQSSDDDIAAELDSVVAYLGKPVLDELGETDEDVAQCLLSGEHDPAMRAAWRGEWSA